MEKKIFKTFYKRQKRSQNLENGIDCEKQFLSKVTLLKAAM